MFELCDPAVVVIDDASFSGIMPERAAIVSGSDNVRVRDAARAAGLRLVSFGADDGDVTTSRVTQTASGKLECDLQLPGEDVLAGVQSAAGTSLESLLAAAAIAHVLGLSADAVRDGLAG
ncbi:MAG: hypothetical protein GY868_09185 [Deltaproteobacteria bacterium]|nr:hypothetical protein [Deltaproteobacteria bacterium]